MRRTWLLAGGPEVPVALYFLFVILRCDRGSVMGYVGFPIKVDDIDQGYLRN